MAVAHLHFFSESLGLSTSAMVILPQQTPDSQIGQAGPSALRNLCPVLYLLHGWSDDETIWLRRTSIDRYASRLGLIVVMPRVDLSFYQNTSAGMHYWDYISEELPQLCRNWFPVSPKREDTFAAGLSMGGYGAFRLGLSHPDKFAAVASLSGALLIERVASPRKELSPRDAKIQGIFGTDPSWVKGSEADLLALARRHQSQGTTLPRLLQICGREDFLYEENLLFRDEAKTLGIDLTYEEREGAHEWGFWDQTIQRVLAWLPIQSSAEGRDED